MRRRKKLVKKYQNIEKMKMQLKCKKNYTFFVNFSTSIKTPNVYVKAKRQEYIRNPVQQKIQQFKRFIENYRRHIVCFIITYSITVGVTLERCYCE